MSNIMVGIDLGTTMSVLSYIDPNGLGKPDISKTKEGAHLTRSMVYFHNAKVIVGSQNSGGSEAREFKRYMGSSDYKFEANGKSYTPTDLSSLVLKKLKEDASANGLDVRDVVITVPAYFDEIRRVATKKAGEMAGLNVVSVINEPTAAALFYVLSTDKQVNGKVLVYDLGGGTFDITIMNINGSEVDIIASGGDPRLGGMDFDKLIMELLKEKYIEEKGGGLPYDEDDERDFENDAEEIKKELSSKKSHTYKAYGTKGKATLKIEREEFEEKMKNYLEGMATNIRIVIKEANLTMDDIDHVLMVGGSTRIPIVRESIEKQTGKKPITTLDADESIAKGAAQMAMIIQARENPNAMPGAIVREASKVNVIEAATVSFGTVALDKNGKEINSIIIKKQTKLPCTEYGEFFTSSDGQTQVDVKITTGESSDPTAVTVVDSFTLDLPGGRPAGQPIKITYAYSQDQSLECIVEDVSTGKTRKYSSGKIL